MKKIIMIILVTVMFVTIGANMTDESNRLSSFIEEQTKWIGADRIVEIVASGESSVTGLWFSYIDKYDGHRWYCCSGVEVE